MTVQGTDLAWCNINVDYKLMKSSGIKFAIIKLGQGMLPKDNMFDIHMHGCATLDIPWNPYWFCDYRYTALANVQQLVAKANGNYGRGRVCQDLEFRSVWGYPTGAKMLSFCLDFHHAMEDMTGIVDTLYTNRDVLNQMWKAATSSQRDELARHELWFATDTPNPSPTYLPILMNQWDLDAQVPWSQGAVDLDVFMGTDEEFEVWKNGTPPPMTITERVDKIESWIRKQDPDF